MKLIINAKKIIFDVILSLMPTVFLITFCIYHGRYDSIVLAALFSLIVTILFLWFSGYARLYFEISKIHKYEMLNCRLIDNVENIGSRGIPVCSPLVEVIVQGHLNKILLTKYRLRYSIARNSNLVLLFNREAPEKSILVMLNPYLVVRH